jgi:ribosomal protein L22
VLALIRGKDVNRALATLKFTRKAMPATSRRCCVGDRQRAAKDGFSGDVDRLFVSACFANQGRRRSGCVRRRWAARSGC